MCGTRPRRRRSRLWHSGHHILGGGHHLPHVPAVVPVSETKEDGLYCLNCDFTDNPTSARFCQNCGAEIARCPISQMPFRVGDKFGQCPSCRTVFHLDHLNMALSKDSSCPYCRTSLSGIGVGTIGVEKVTIN